MTDRSIASLYRRLNAQPHPAAADLLDAETLVAAAAGTLRGDRRDEVAALLSRSELHTGLVRMLRELTPAAEALARQLGERDVTAHGRLRSRYRHAMGARRQGGLRWAGLAACLMVAVGAVSWQHQRALDQEAAMLAAMEAAARPDRIFTSVDRIFTASIDAHGSAAAGDGVFHSSFNDG